MKPVAFDYARPRSIDAALDILGSADNAKILAGGQTLGPMLNLRLVQPALLVDITRIADLVTVADDGDALAIGACVTHAAIEDARLKDPANGFLAVVARGIAYRAVRTRGTIGGSLAHADPAADWLAALLALGAEVEIAGTSGRRRTGLQAFVHGAMETDLGADEVLARVLVSKLKKNARAGFHKICRKTGEFAEAIGAVMLDKAAGECRMVAAGGSEAAIVFENPGVLFRSGDPFDREAYDIDMAMAALGDAGMGDDPYEMRLRAVAIGRALADAQPS